MSVLASRDVLRPSSSGIKQSVMAFGMGQLPLVFRALRAVWPIPHFGNSVMTTRYDDVREVFLTDGAFGVPYARKLDVIMGDQPFFLGMDDTARYRADTAAMRKVIRAEDIPARLAPAIESAAEAVVSNAG